MTAGPLVGPASAYPTFRTPASICFREPNDGFVPGLIEGRPAGFVLRDRASAEPIKPSSADAKVMAAMPKKWRRPRLICSDISSSSLHEAPDELRNLIRRGIEREMTRIEDVD